MFLAITGLNLVALLLVEFAIVFTGGSLGFGYIKFCENARVSLYTGMVMWLFGMMSLIITLGTS